MKKKVAVIGAGKWGQNIVRTLHGLGELACVVEADEYTCELLRETYPDLIFYQRHEAVLNDDSITAVAIATPVASHYSLAKQALLSGKDVFVEKPLSMLKAEAEELVKIANQQQKILMVGHMLLYQPAVQFIKQFIQDGKLGALYSLRQVRRNLGTIRNQENVLFSLGVHDLAVLSYLVDKPIKEIKAVGQAALRSHIEDDVSAHITYQSGIQAHLHVCWLWPYKERTLMVLGEKGALFYDELKHTVTFYKNFGHPDATVTEHGEEVVFSGSAQPLKLEMIHFLEVIRTRKKPNSCGAQGVEVIGLLEAITNQIKKAEFQKVLV